MRLHTGLFLVILETFSCFILVVNEGRKIDGYKFPVYSTPFCPRNESEWNKRSSTLNCNKTNGYTCLPNQHFTELLEFCYTQPRILIEKGTCLYLVERISKVNGHNCHNFTYGCHNTAFLSDRIFDYPACISLGNGCFLAEPSCKSGRLTEKKSTNVKENHSILLGIIIPICVLFVLVCGCYVFFIKKFQICQRQSDAESSEVEKLTQFKELDELNDIDSINEENPLLQEKRAFERHEDEKMEILIYDYQHADENSERHEVEMLTPFVDKNKQEKKNMAYKDSPARNRNVEESFKEEIVAQSFENNHPINTDPMKITAPTKEVSVIYRRKRSLESDEKEKINQLSCDKQHNDGNANKRPMGHIAHLNSSSL